MIAQGPSTPQQQSAAQRFPRYAAQAALAPRLPPLQHEMESCIFKGLNCDKNVKAHDEFENFTVWIVIE
jgi:hypothetical protein